MVSEIVIGNDSGFHSTAHQGKQHERVIIGAENYTNIHILTINCYQLYYAKQLAVKFCRPQRDVASQVDYALATA